LQREIASSALTNKVILTGPLPQEEVVARLARSVVFALPCVEETAGGMDNLPTVIMEAMATGLPVISTPISGVPEMVVHNQTGLLVPEHQPTAVAEAIAQLLSDRKLARSLGQNGRDRTAASFDLRTTVASLHDLFTRLSVGT
jgi:glycosyltransferase involved in cell wall biosynthesis